MRALEKVSIDGARCCNLLDRVPSRDAQHADRDVSVLVRRWIQNLTETRARAIAADDQTALDGGAIVEMGDGTVVEAINSY